MQIYSGATKHKVSAGTLEIDNLLLSIQDVSGKMMAYYAYFETAFSRESDCSFTPS